MSKIIKASQIRQEEKLRQLFAEKIEKPSTVTSDDTSSKSEVSEEIKTAQREAASILEKAQAEAEKLVKETMQEAEAEVEHFKEVGYHEGFHQGFEEGYQAGYDQVIKEMENMLQNLKREIDRTQMILDNQIQGLSPQVIKLSSEIAGKIIRRQVNLNPEIIIDQVEHILKGISRVKNLAIRVNPKDIERVKNAEEHFLQLTQGIDEIDFVIDHSLEPGGCIIETNSGGVDASIQTQLEMITSILLEGNGDEDA